MFLRHVVSRSPCIRIVFRSRVLVVVDSHKILEVNGELFFFLEKKGRSTAKSYKKEWRIIVVLLVGLISLF